MANGHAWKPEHTDTLRAWAGRLTDSEIGILTGHSGETIRKRRTSMGLKPIADRRGWRRRDYLLADACGLDFQIPD